MKRRTKSYITETGVKEMEKDVWGKLIGYFIFLMIVLAGAILALHSIGNNMENVSFDYQQEERIVITEEIEHI
ncbi:hypothetical protein GN156_13220 [bacterium LRH843]|nr:hypothetical protein [bacterium LRH843]